MIAGASFAQIKHITQQGTKVKKYEAARFEICLTGNWENPYLQEEAALDMLITAPSG